jgi:hypothetical protein
METIDARSGKRRSYADASEECFLSVKPPESWLVKCCNPNMLMAKRMLLLFPKV